MVELPPEIVEANEFEQIQDLNFDGSATHNGLGIGILLKFPTGEVLDQALRLNYQTTNNETEYETLITGLCLAKALEIEHVNAHCDFQLIASQFNGDYEAKDKRMSKYRELVQQLDKEFATFKLLQIARSENKSADALATLAITPNLYHKTIPIEAINEPSIDLPRGVCAINHEDDFMKVEDDGPPADLTDASPIVDWRTPINLYIADGKEPADKCEARRLKARTCHYTMIDDGLYDGVHLVYSLHAFMAKKPKG